MLVLGDDNLMVACRKFIESLGPGASTLVKLLSMLGLELEPKVHVGPQAKYTASFCSARFYPVAGGKCVLAPGIGRGLAKSAWYVDSPVNMPIERMVRGDAIGKMRDCWFVPFLGPMWRKNLELTKGFAGKEILSRNLIRSSLHNAHAVVTHEASAETYEMVEALYGLTRTDEEEYIKLLSTVKSLPSIVNLSKFHHAMVVDGVTEDVLNEVCPDVEERKENSSPLFSDILQRNIQRLKSVFGTSAPVSHANVQYSVLGADNTSNDHGCVSLVWDN
jgi:hypothetical protein